MHVLLDCVYSGFRSGYCFILGVPVTDAFPPSLACASDWETCPPHAAAVRRNKTANYYPAGFSSSMSWNMLSPSLWGNSGLANNINANISYCWRAGGSILGSVWHSHDCCNWTRNLKHVNQPPHRALLKATVPLKRVSLHCISQDTLTLWRYAITFSDTFYKEYVSNSHIYWSEEGKMGRRDFKT